MRRRWTAAALLALSLLWVGVASPLADAAGRTARDGEARPVEARPVEAPGAQREERPAPEEMAPPSGSLAELRAVEAGEVRAEGRMMRICVWDNGHGLPESMTGAYQRMDSAVTRGHVGLYNVDTILLKHYGEGFGLYLDNRPGGTGAAVTAAVPIRREEEPPC